MGMRKLGPNPQRRFHMLIPRGRQGGLHETHAFQVLNLERRPKACSRCMQARVCCKNIVSAIHSNFRNARCKLADAEFALEVFVGWTQTQHINSLMITMLPFITTFNLRYTYLSTMLCSILCELHDARLQQGSLNARILLRWVLWIHCSPAPPTTSVIPASPLCP